MLGLATGALLIKRRSEETSQEITVEQGKDQVLNQTIHDECYKKIVETISALERANALKEIAQNDYETKGEELSLKSLKTREDAAAFGITIPIEVDASGCDQILKVAEDLIDSKIGLADSSAKLNKTVLEREALSEEIEELKSNERILVQTFRSEDDSAEITLSSVLSKKIQEKRKLEKERDDINQELSLIHI